MPDSPLRLNVWSDYLCPWCWLETARMKALEEEFGGLVEIRWKSFFLRPEKGQIPRDLEQFRDYTQTWKRPASEADAPEFRVWEGDAGPPSHSLPPHQVAKAAAELGDDAFRKIHDGLMRAYFAENRDITDEATLLEIWLEAGLEASAFARSRDPEMAARAWDEFKAGLEVGATGVPAVEIDGTGSALVGAHPTESYRRWIQKNLNDESEES